MTKGDERILPEALQRLLLDAITGEGMPAPPARLLGAILARIVAEPDFASSPTVAPWTQLAPGVEGREIADDGERRTWLARFAPGASLAPHDHPGDEECFVIAGSVFLDDELLGEGSYQLAPAGSRHEKVLAPAGCLLLVLSPSFRAIS